MGLVISLLCIAGFGPGFVATHLRGQSLQTGKWGKQSGIH